MRIATVAAILVLLPACATVRAADDSGADAPEPAARTVVDGVEMWDLTGEPSAEAFGIADDSRTGIYETEAPRPIVLELPGDASVRLEARLVTFERSVGDNGDRYTFGIRGATVEPEELHGQLQSLAQQLEIAPDTVDVFIAEVMSAPPEQTERIRYSSPTAAFGDLELGVAANVAPIAGAGRFTVGGVWE